ncbi:MAG TPA: hypothetical protein VMV86_05620 [Methanosarcinales archaeon]|nr:hypothetical protein [Methanosarcinales archaeon]
MKIGYQCGSCGEFHESLGGTYIDNQTETKPWLCPVCKKEACQRCYWKFAAHKKCCEGKTDAELIEIADNAGFNFKDK